MKAAVWNLDGTDTLRLTGVDELPKGTVQVDIERVGEDEIKLNIKQNKTMGKFRQLIERRLQEENPYTGWENLPPGWDEDSLESFAQNLTGQEGEEGFFTACMDKMEDEMDEPEAFCASLKDEYLDREDWRGED